MRFVRFEIPTPFGREARLGVVSADDTLVDVNLAHRWMLRQAGLGDRSAAVADCLLPPDLLAYLETGVVGQRAMRETLEFVAAEPLLPDGVRIRWPLDEVRLLAPLVPVSYRECGQFEKHQSRHGRRTIPQVWREIPTYWKGNPSSTLGPEDVIPWPSYTTRMDFELEIAAVIGRRGINIDPAHAMEYVAGFTIFNDVSARDQQFREMERGVGPSKGKDFANVLGPVLVTPEEIDHSRFHVRVKVNGEQWVEADTSEMRFGWRDLIAYVSKDELLVPGDVFTSGTVSGCSGLEHFDYPQSGPLLNPGDVVELEVAGIGMLRNRIGNPAS